MIRTDTNKSLIKQRKAEEDKLRDEAVKSQCIEIANQRFGESKVTELSNKHKGLWFLPVMDVSGETVEKIALMRPIDRHILNYASTKIADDGLYTFLEACMQECFVDGDRDIFDDDEYFIPAAQQFNKIMESRKAYMLKR